MDALDYNFAHALSCFASTGKTGEVLDRRDLLITNTRGPLAEFNQCLLKTPDYKLERTVQRLLAYRQSAGVPLRVHLASEHAAAAAVLLENGFVSAEQVPAMALQPIDRVAAATHDLPPGVSIRRANGRDGLLDFATTAFASFGFPVELAPIAMTEALMALPHVELYVGYVEEAPVCCSALVRTGAVAGIYWVGVRDGHRRRGLGAAVTARAALAGSSHGCSVASLQASAMGAPVYRRMGFSTVRQYLRFDLPASQA